ncbi:MAG: hypothetical protein J6Z02_04920 [Lachnospiraceae bacterium]|nr:hypothetical protein [Lachnospiraceae bacterium]
MEREEYIKRLSVTGSDLWRSCREAQSGLDESIVTTCIGDITGNLSKYIEVIKDEVIGRLERIEALSCSLGLTERDEAKVRGLKDTVSGIGKACSSIDEYIIDACSLTGINERLKVVV